MRRVLVLGCPASGKSTLARKLAIITGLPLVHLDRIFWRPNWVEVTEDEFRADLAVELIKDAWIIDGNYGRTLALRLERADTAILLDFPKWLCLWRAVKRSVTGWGRSRPDMGSGCPEKLDLEFFRFIWRFHREQRPKLLAEFDRFPGRKIVLRSSTETGRLIADLKSEVTSGT